MSDPAKLTVRKYDLPDSTLLDVPPENGGVLVWVPELTAVVLGSGNSLDRSVYTGRILEDGIPVYRRPSGGEAIFLSPCTMVISVLKKRGGFSSVKDHFSFINNRIIKGLSILGVEGISHNGMSDLTLNGRKILGSAIYQNFERVFYHGVLNICENGERIQRYLRHPRREPDYRRGRNHQDFVTSFAEQGYSLDTQLLKESLVRSLQASTLQMNISEILGFRKYQNFPQ